MNNNANQEEIENWLKIGLSQSPERFSEMFYFDKQDNQFFSILITDYFLFDDEFEINKKTSSNYSETNLKLLIDKMKRIENEDNSMLSIPRFGELSEEELFSNIDSFLNLNAINLENTSIWEIEETGDVVIDLRDEKPKLWWQFWK
ncbi:hypothetical protein GKZ90_0000315 [Flavobacterium sp. MC2016-06]|jgi:hypothetical protein|uniref:hypothetical protein n=1 Tax=Flavobacterium sp. MC2016-06 TaxID=2676308 RepID=UPI0012BA802E|nr:hypothetical protein [Flavobacterium sp. MC2016-06]MBU3859569.1 hypothetical protein [Flavobacterium sp. MC2016-06]